MDFIFVWLVSFVIGYWIIKKINERKNLPPGPWGLPIVGYLPNLNRKHPHLTLTELSRQYGSIYAVAMGSVYTVVLSDHRLIREAFAKDVFTGRAPLYLTHGIMKGNGIICAEGPLWKDQRKLLTAWLRRFGMSKHGVSREKLEKRIDSGIDELLENIKETSGTRMDLSKIIAQSFGNVVNDIIFGFKFPPEDKTWHWCRQIQEEGCHEMGVAGIVNFLPFVRFILPSVQKTFDFIVRGQAQTHRLYASIIARRRKMLGLEKPKQVEFAEHADIFNEHPKGFIKCIKYSKNISDTDIHYFDPDVMIPSDGECILDNYLVEQKRRCDSNEESAKFMTDEQLHFILADMFGAGLDTTSSSLSWYLLYMALHQEEQEKVRKEILDIYPEDCQVDYTKLPYMMATICEAQRIRTIVPVGIPHGCLEDTYLGKYRIPKGAMVVPLQWALHMDPNVWENPEEFKPSRFVDKDGNLLKPSEFIPFQTGKRMCPGDELSRMVSSSLVARLFRSYRISLGSDPPTEEEMKGEVGVTLTAPKTLFICESL